MSKHSIADLEWALRTIISMQHFGGEADMLDVAKQALEGGFAGVAESCATHTDNVGHPDWKPSQVQEDDAEVA